MRLREISKILSENVDNLNIGISQVANSSTYKITDLNKFRDSLNKIETTDLFGLEIIPVKQLSLFHSTVDTLIVSFEDYSKLNSNIISIKKNIINLIESINNAITEETNPDNTVSIKLPDDLDFENLSKILDLLKKSLSIPLADSSVNDNIKIKAFETGSFWIDVSVHSVEAVSLIGAITWSGAFIYRQQLEGKKHNEYSRGLKLKNDVLDSISKAFKAQIDIYIEAEAKNLQSNFYEGDSNEKLERLKLAIKSMYELIDKGTEIHPSLLASDKTDLTFPSFKNLNLIESKTKRLTEGS